MMLPCVGCGGDINPRTSVCETCARYMTVREEQEWRKQLVVPRKDIADDKLDMAERGVT